MDLYARLDTKMEDDLIIAAQSTGGIVPPKKTYCFANNAEIIGYCYKILYLCVVKQKEI